jgi:hypothetical protein
VQSGLPSVTENEWAWERESYAGTRELALEDRVGVEASAFL